MCPARFRLASTTTLLDEEVLAFFFASDEPFGAELLLLGSTAAAPVETAARGGIDGEAEHVLWFDEIGYKFAAIYEKISEAEEVGEENEAEDCVEDCLPFLGAPGGVVLCLNGCVESLVLWSGEGGDGGGVIPVMDKGGVSGTSQ